MSRLERRWEFEARSGITATPVVVGDFVIAGSWDGSLYALDRRSGKLRWEFSAGTRSYPPDRTLGVFATVAVEAGRVHVACDRLLALDLGSGKLLWETVIGDPATTLEYFWAPPLAHGDRVYAGVSAGSEFRTRGRVVCIDARNGKHLWKLFTVERDVAGGAVIAPPSLDAAEETLFVATGNPFRIRPGPLEHSCSLIALDAATGDIRWADQVHPHDTRNLDLNCPPLLLTVERGGERAKLVVVGGKDGLRAWERSTGRRLWRVQLTPAIEPGAPTALPTNGPEAGPTAAAGGLVFFASNNHSDQSCVLAAINAASGELVWVRTLPAFQFGPMSVANGVVYMGLVDGKLRAWRAKDGKLLWQDDAGQPIAGGPSIAHGMVFVGTGAGSFLPGKKLLAYGIDR